MALKFVPLIVTSVPIGPIGGLNELSMGTCPKIAPGQTQFRTAKAKRIRRDVVFMIESRSAN